MLTIAEDAFLRAARAAQYDTFLANPGAGRRHEPRRLRLRHRRAAAAAPAAPGSGGGLGALGLALALAGGLVVAGGLAVGWAHL